MDFDPDAFLAGNAEPAEANTTPDFDPDAFLASTPPPAPTPLEQEKSKLRKENSEGLGGFATGVAGNLLNPAKSLPLAGSILKTFAWDVPKAAIETAAHAVTNPTGGVKDVSSAVKTGLLNFGQGIDKIPQFLAVRGGKMSEADIEKYAKANIQGEKIRETIKNEAAHPQNVDPLSIITDPTNLLMFGGGAAANTAVKGAKAAEEALQAGHLVGAPEVLSRVKQGAEAVSKVPVKPGSKAVAKVADLVGGVAGKGGQVSSAMQNAAKKAVESALPGLGEDAQRVAGQAASMAGAGWVTGSPLLGVFSGTLPTLFKQIASVSKAAARAIQSGEGSIPFFRKLAQDPNVVGLPQLAAKFLDSSGMGDVLEGIGRSIKAPIDHPGMPAAFAAYGVLSSGGDVDQASANIFNAYAIPVMGAGAAEPFRANSKGVIAGKQITDVANYFKTLTPEQQQVWIKRFDTHKAGASHVADELIATAQLTALRPGTKITYSEGVTPHVNLKGEIVLPINPVDSKGQSTDYLGRILAHEMIHEDLSRVQGGEEGGVANRAGILSSLVGNPATQTDGVLIKYGPNGEAIASPTLQRFQTDYLSNLQRSLENTGTPPEQIVEIIKSYSSDPVKMSEEWLAEHLGSIWTSQTGKGELAYTRMARGGKFDAYNLQKALKDPKAGVLATMSKVFGVDPDSVRKARWGDDSDIPANILKLGQEIKNRGFDFDPAAERSFASNEVSFKTEEIAKNPKAAAAFFDGSNNIEWRFNDQGQVVGVDRILTKRQAEQKQQLQSGFIKNWLDTNAPGSPDEVQKRVEVDVNGKTTTKYRGRVIPEGLKQAIIQSKLWNPMQLVAFERLQKSIIDGTPIEVMYQAALKNGKYAALEAAPRTIVPFNFLISTPEGKGGANILVENLNLTRLEQNYREAIERNRDSKNPVEVPPTFHEVIKQLYGIFQNYERGYHGTGEVPQGRVQPVEPPAMVLTEHQRNFINELLGIDMASNRGRNQFRNLLESENLDSSNSTINSFRLDRINNINPGELPDIKVNYQKAKDVFSPVKEHEEKQHVNVSLSANTDTIEGIKKLNEAAAKGDLQAHRLLGDIAHDSLQHLTSGIPSVKIEFTRATGLYGGAFEPSLGLKMSFDEQDRPAALAALAKFADNFNQEQVHVRAMPERNTPIGHMYEDGSYNVPSFKWELKEPISREQVEAIAAGAGLPGLTLADNYIEVYYAKDPNNERTQRDFFRATHKVPELLGSANGGVSATVERLWPYGKGSGAIPYDRIQGQLRTGEAKHNPTAKRVAERLASRNVEPVPQAKEMSPEQAKLHTDIAAAYEKLGDNNLDNPKVKQAYEELDKELREQFSALPVKVEVLSGKGEPYKNSAEMRKDVLENNHLSIFGTDKNSFGPKGVEYNDHPLLRDSGFKDVNGKPLLTNDLLRAVHDYYAHTMSPVQFGPLGEEAAWKNHMAMTKSPLARMALTSETRGQNSYVNYGPHGEANRANPSATNFAPQKVDLLPAEYAKTGHPELDKEIDAADAKRYSAVDDHDNLRGWIDSSGKFNSIGNMMHNEYAMKHTGLTTEQAAADALYSKNWLRTRVLGPYLFVSNENGKAPTPKQITELKNLAIENDLKKVLFESPAGSRTLWTPSDEGGERFSPITDKDDQTKTPEFKKWFRDSKVVDKAGNPLVVYHGTDKDFTKFDTKKFGATQQIWFTSDKSEIENGTIGAAGKGKIMDMFASIQKPANWTIFDKLTLDEMLAQGYDGAILPHDGHIVGFVFDPEQVKSASKNVGTFDKNNPDIRYSGVEDDVVGGKTISQRLPTGVNATEDPMKTMLKVGLDESKLAKESLTKNALMLKKYPGFTGSGRPEQIAEQFVNHVKDNLLWLYDKVPQEVRDRSKLWYDGANKLTQDWSKKYGHSPEAIAGVLATQSPQKDWFQNVSLANRILDIYKDQQDHVTDDKMMEVYKTRPAINKGNYAPHLAGKSFKELLDAKDYTLAAVWLRLYDEAHNDRGHRMLNPEGTFGDLVKTKSGLPYSVAWGNFANVAKALEILQNPDIKNISDNLGEMHKVRNFYNNIINPNSPHGDVTIDTHAVAAGLLRPLAGDDLEVGHNFGAGASNNSIFGLKGTYGLYAEAYRRAAKERGLLPRQMQSITWEAVRGMFPDTFKTPANKLAIDNIWKEYKLGKKTLNETREEIIKLSGGIENPTWHGRRVGLDEAGKNPSNSGELPGTSVHGGDTGAVDSGTGSGTPTPISEKSDRRKKTLEAVSRRKGSVRPTG